VLVANLTACIENPEQVDTDGYPLGEIERMLMKVA
jgi:hypothetical protein